MYTEDQIGIKNSIVNMLHRVLEEVEEVDLTEKSSAVRFQYKKKTYRVILSRIHHYFVEEVVGGCLEVNTAAHNLNKKFDADIKRKSNV